MTLFTNEYKKFFMKTIKEQLEQFLKMSGTSSRKLAMQAAILLGETDLERTTQIIAVSLSGLRTGKQKDIMSTLADALRLAMRELDNETAEKLLGK